MLSLILPTLNEAGNLPSVIHKLQLVLRDVPHEIIIVDDDSKDGTWQIARGMSKKDPSVRMLLRIGRRGLSSAIIEGFMASKGSILAVADADGQHDYAILPRLYQYVTEHSGIAIGSRYAEGGGVGQWSSHRHLLSRTATFLAIRLCRQRVADPLSGYFAIRREVFDQVSPFLHPKGFKILFSILSRLPPSIPVVEFPYTFDTRRIGKSKLTLRVRWQFLVQLLLEFFMRFVFGRMSDDE